LVQHAWLEPDGRAGVLHAKALVADDEFVFVTAANTALDRNIEVGLLVRDRTLAARLLSACSLYP
jgi:phosphatidylserine/phosphatidylglycerophosphate/cardiolipin synthase-like enzyme